MKKDWRRSAWRGLGHVLAPPLRLWLRRRVARGKEIPERLPERFGKAGLARPPGKLIWAHGASNGEAMALLPLLRALREARPDLSLLITTGTVTSAALVAARGAGLVQHQFLPLDLPSAGDAFLNHWRPDLVLWSESDLWPGFLSSIAERGIPALLVNARMSARSMRRWQQWPKTAAWLLKPFRAIYAQTATDAERFRALGGQEVQSIGNLKLAAEALPAEEGALREAANLLGPRPRWLMASTHPGEETAAGRLHKRLAERFPGLLTVIVPRHPPRGAAIAAELRAMGLNVAQRSQRETPAPGTDIYLADTLGELGIWYRLVPIVAMGGALIPHGGQNPLEPARLGAAVVAGPHMFNFSEAIADLIQAGAAVSVNDETALGDALTALLADPAAVHRLGEAGRAYANQGEAVLNRLRDAALAAIKA